MENCGYFLEGDEKCLPVGYKIGGKMHVNAGMATMDFLDAFKISPNSPNGETEEFYFLVKEGTKTADFYFDQPPAIQINISGLNP
jgi:hypothetical protein